MINIFKGFLIGIGKIIPGVSGSIIAISLGVYEPIINILGNLSSINKEKIIYITKVLFGIIIAILLFSKLILYFLNTYYVQTMLLFLGLITGCLNGIIKRAKREINIINIILLLLPLIIILFINNLNIKFNVSITPISVFLIGIIEAITMIIPGISGTAVLMYINVYNDILRIISTYNTLLIPFILGILIGFIILAKIISKILKNTKSEYIIIGFMISTLLVILKQTLNYKYTLLQLIIGINLFIFGYIITKRSI